MDSMTSGFVFLWGTVNMQKENISKKKQQNNIGLFTYTKQAFILNSTYLPKKSIYTGQLEKYL